MFVAVVAVAMVVVVAAVFVAVVRVAVVVVVAVVIVMPVPVVVVVLKVGPVAVGASVIVTVAVAQARTVTVPVPVQGSVTEPVPVGVVVTRLVSVSSRPHEGERYYERYLSGTERRLPASSSKFWNKRRWRTHVFRLLSKAVIRARASDLLEFHPDSELVAKSGEVACVARHHQVISFRGSGEHRSVDHVGGAGDATHRTCRPGPGLVHVVDLAG